MEARKFNNTDEYIADSPLETQKLLKKLRATIKKVAPQAEEVISYNMPAYKYKGMLVYFAAFKNHIGFYPMASAIIKFKKEISEYKNAKGSVQFPINKPIPFDLVSEIIKFRLVENIQKAEMKLKK